MTDGTIRRFAPAAALFLACTAALVAVTLRAPAAPGEPVAILFSPQTTLLDAVAAVGSTGGVVARTGRWDNIVVASFPGRAAPVDALRASGAWLVFNAAAAGGCDAAASAVAQTLSSRTKGVQL